MIPARMDPAAERGLFLGILQAEFSTGTGSEHKTVKKEGYFKGFGGITCFLYLSIIFV